MLGLKIVLVADVVDHCFTVFEKLYRLLSRIVEHYWFVGLVYHLILVGVGLLVGIVVGNLEFDLIDELARVQ